MVINAEYDRLRASGEAFTAALAVAGVDVRQVTVPGVLHGFLNQPAELEPVGRCLDLIAAVVAVERAWCRHERPAAGAPRLPPRPEHLPGRRHLLPGDVELRVRARACRSSGRPTCARGSRSATCWTGPSQLDVSKAGPSGGIFAPTLRHHDGRFWMITTNWSDDGGQLLVHAEDPAGPWSEPVRIPSAMGIDPDLAWDDDGTCLMSYDRASARTACRRASCSRRSTRSPARC